MPYSWRSMTSDVGAYIAVGIVMAMVGDMIFYDGCSCRCGCPRIEYVSKLFGVNIVAGQSCVLNRNEGWRLLWPFPGTLVPVESSFLFFLFFLRHTRLSLLSARSVVAVVVVVGKSEQKN